MDWIEGLNSLVSEKSSECKYLDSQVKALHASLAEKETKIQAQNLENYNLTSEIRKLKWENKLLENDVQIQQ